MISLPSTLRCDISNAESGVENSPRVGICYRMSPASPHQESSEILPATIGNEAQDKAITVLAVASRGGHWEQMMLLRPALERFDVRFATTDSGLGARDGLDGVIVLPDANRSSGLRVFICFLRAWTTVRALKPDVVLSTGAMPGLFCLIAGRSVGARTVWIDSIANSEQASMSGSLARWVASLWLTQWEHLARPAGPHYVGSVF